MRGVEQIPWLYDACCARPFRRGAFDTVVSGFVFCSVSDAARVARAG